MHFFPTQVARIATISLLVSLSTAQTCYNSDGTIAEYARPCTNTTLHQTCCDPGWTCTEANICVWGSDGSDYFHRGSCTDPTFNDTNCPRYCLDANMNGHMLICNTTATWTEVCCDIINETSRCECSGPNQWLGALQVIAQEASKNLTTGFASAVPTSDRYFLVVTSMANQLYITSESVYPPDSIITVSAPSTTSTLTTSSTTTQTSSTTGSSDAAPQSTVAPFSSSTMTSYTSPEFSTSSLYVADSSTAAASSTSSSGAGLRQHRVLCGTEKGGIAGFGLGMFLLLH